MQKQFKVKIQKLNKQLGLLFGYAIICKNGDEDYYDTQGDHIPEDSMLDAATDFFLNSERTSDEMHFGKSDGTVVFGFPMTQDIAASLGITIKKSGLLIGMKPSKEVFEKAEEGDYFGFSIGGDLLEYQEVED